MRFAAGRRRTRRRGATRPERARCRRPGGQEALFPPEAGQQQLLDGVGQIGILLLVGLSGAQLDTAFVRRKAAVVSGVSIGAFLVPLAFGIGVGMLLPDSLIGEGTDRGVFAVFLGVALSLSAIPIVAKALSEMKMLHRNVGQLTLASGAVDDALGWLVLSVVSAVATVGIRADRLAVTLVAALALVPIAWFVLRPLTDRVLTGLARSGNHVGIVTAAVVLIVGCAAATQALHLEAVLGAFAAGLALGGTFARQLAPLRTVVFGVLAPLFLASAGLRVDLAVLGNLDVLMAMLAVLAVAIIGKFVGAYLGGRLVRLPHWDSLALGAGLNARGVVEIVIAMIGLSIGVLTAESYTVIVLVAVVTSMAAPPMLRFAMRRVDTTAEEEARRELGEAWEPDTGHGSGNAATVSSDSPERTAAPPTPPHP